MTHKKSWIKPSIYAILSLGIIFCAIHLLVTFFQDETPHFFPLDNPHGEYTITKKCPHGQGIIKKYNIVGEAYCLEYRGEGVIATEPQINNDFFRITIGRSDIDLEQLNGKQVKNLTGKFTGSSQQCINEKCIDIGGPYAVLDITSLEIAE